MTIILMIGGILLLLLLSSSSERRYSRYDNYDRPYPPPHPYYPMPQYDASHDYYRYREERTRSSLVATAIFIALIIGLMFLFGGDSTDNKMSSQDTYSTSQQPQRYR
jgi:hypothetical protein